MALVNIAFTYGVFSHFGFIFEFLLSLEEVREEFENTFYSARSGKEFIALYSALNRKYLISLKPSDKCCLKKLWSTGCHANVTQQRVTHLYRARDTTGTKLCVAHPLIKQQLSMCFNIQSFEKFLERSAQKLAQI